MKRIFFKQISGKYAESKIIKIAVKSLIKMSDFGVDFKLSGLGS